MLVLRMVIVVLLCLLVMCPTVGTEGSSGEEVIRLGVHGHKFLFEKDSPCDVRCVLCSVAPDGGSSRVVAVEAFVESCFPLLDEKQ